MTCILSGIISLIQHINTIKKDPERYRWPQCPHCGKAGLWFHGTYPRKPDRSSHSADSLNPVAIPRFFCPSCEKTCSVLPECIPPRRWYLWDVQQAALLSILLGKRFRALSQSIEPAKSTLRRWRKRFEECFQVQRDALCAECNALSRFLDFNEFWIACLDRFSLSKAMLICHEARVSIP
jgi:transposase-like protein